MTAAKKTAAKKTLTVPAKKVVAKKTLTVPAKKVVAAKKTAPATDKHSKKLSVAWEILVKWQGDSQAELARVLGVSRVAVQRWKVHGAVGRESAFVASLLPGCPLTFEAIRPDIKNLDPAVEKGLRVHAKTCIAYIKARDKERAEEAKVAARLLKAQAKVQK